MIKRLNLLIFRSSDIPFDPLDIFVSGVKSISLVQRSIKIRIDDSFKLPSPRFRVYRFWSAIRRRNCGGRVQWTTIESVLTALSEREQIARPACCVCLVIYRRAGQTRRRTSTVMQEREKKRKLEPIGWAKGPSQEQCRSKFRVASVPCLSSCLSLCPLWLYLCSPYNTHTHTHTDTDTHIYVSRLSAGKWPGKKRGRARRRLLLDLILHEIPSSKFWIPAHRDVCILLWFLHNWSVSRFFLPRNRGVASFPFFFSFLEKSCVAVAFSTFRHSGHSIFRVICWCLDVTV